VPRVLDASHEPSCQEEGTRCFSWRETRAALRGGATSRACNISGSPDSLPSPELLGTLVTSRKRKVPHNTRPSFFTRDLSSQSLTAWLTVVTSAVVEYPSTAGILGESVCHLLARPRGLYCVSLQNPRWRPARIPPAQMNSSGW